MQVLLVFMVCASLLCGVLAQQVVVPVPLVPYSTSGSDSDTESVGAFYPNGTLARGASAYFSVDVSHVPKHYSISVYPVYLGSTANNVTLQLYLKKGSIASASNWDDTNSFACTTTSSCYFLDVILHVGGGVGQCDPKDGTYYFTVTNTGLTAAQFQLEVAIDEYAGTATLCKVISDFWTMIGMGAALFVTIIVLSCGLCIGLLVLLCCCCCRRRPVHHYIPVIQEHHHHAVHHGHHDNHHGHHGQH